MSVAALLVATAATGCVTARDAESPKVARGDATRAFVKAFDAEMTNPLADGGYFDAIDAAVANPDDSGSLPVVIASLHALVVQLDTDSPRTSVPVAYRSREGMERAVLRLRQAWDALDGSKSGAAPLMRGHIAHALHGLALYSGEAHGANVWAGRTGCASSATVVGPVDVSPLAALEQASPVSMTEGIRAQYPALTNLKAPVVPTVVAANACEIDTHSIGSYSGVFDVVVDVQSSHAQTLSFLVTTNAAASLRVGDKTVVERRFDMGAPAATVMGQADVGEGTVRVLLRIADRGDSMPVELDVLGDDGTAVPLSAPTTGATASAKVIGTRAVPISAAGGDTTSSVVGAAALLGLGQARQAEHDIESFKFAGGASSPALALLYVRAMSAAVDVPDARRIERTKASLDEVLKPLPNAWEARLLETELTERRKGVGDGVFAALKDMGISTPMSDLSKLDVMEHYGVTNLAREAGVDDVAERAYDELAKKAPGSAILARTDATLHARTGRDALKAACEGGGDHSSNACFMALNAIGDRRGAKAEIERLRELRSAPTMLQGSELALALADGDEKKALAIYDSMPAGSRSVEDILPLLAKDRPAAEARIRRDLTTSQDGVAVLTKLGLVFGEPNTDAKRYEDEGRTLVEEDRKDKKMAGAATAVLRHVEHYGLDDDGLLHVFTYDLRRVSGTTDVEQSASGMGAYIEGRGTGTTLRRRIYKKDGRVLEPDTADRSQTGGDLSQLEQGDYVEEITTAYYLPTEGGELTIDTNDVLPERTSIREAEIAFRLPEKLEVPMWAHQLLGKPTTETKGGYKFVTYRIANQGARRLEDGIPPIEQGVRVSLSTETWPKIARTIHETILSLGDADPFMRRYASEAAAKEGEAPAKPGTPPAAVPQDLATVGRVVEHVGHSLKIANGGQISDMASAYGGGPQGQTARYMIEDHQGSRSWVIYRTLKELGFNAELAVAETTPFSTSADFPPHPGRFGYPLVVVHLPDGDKWIDADIEGPPLPPGRVSPELRGRNAVLAEGKIVPVQGSTDAAFDDVDMQLTVDAKGTAKGTIAVTLRGRQAQSLSESFNTIVGSDRREVLRRVIQSWMPWADVDDVKLQSAEGAYEVVIHADVSIHGFGSPEGHDAHALVLAGLDPTRGGTLSQAYASRGGRQSALSIESPIQYHVKRKIQLASGMTLVKAPTKLDLASQFLHGTRTTTIDGNVVSDEFDLSLPTGMVPAESYGLFVDNVQSVDSGFLAGIHVKVAP